MAKDLPALMIRNDILYITLDGRIEDPALRRVVDCVRGLTAFVDSAAERHGSGTVMVSLVAIAVNMALRHGNGDLIADALHQNAEMLEADRRLRAAASGLWAQSERVGL